MLLNGSLHVAVDNSPWLSELTLLAPDLTARLQAEFPAIRSVRFSLGVAPAEERPAAARPSPRAAAPLSDHDRRAIDAAAAAISDPALAASARRLLARGWPSPARGNER